MDEELTMQAKLELAAQEIAASQMLRFALRQFLVSAGVLPQQSVFGPDALQNAFDQGRQAAGLVLVSMLGPALWLQLQKEEMTDVQSTE